MDTDCYFEIRGIEDWIRDIEDQLLYGEYTNRSKLQRRLVVLEEIKCNLMEKHKRYKGISS